MAVATVRTRSRLTAEERRAQLVAVGVELLRSRPLDQLALEDVAAAAGISRALPFHYFPTRRDFLVAVIEAAADELLAATDPAPDMLPLSGLRHGIQGYIEFIDANPTGYVAIVRGAAGADDAIAAVCDRTRDAIVDGVLSGLSDAGADPLLRLAVRGWVGFVEETAVAWLRDRTVPRDELVWLLEEALIQAVSAVADRHHLTLDLDLEDR